MAVQKHYFLELGTAKTTIIFNKVSDLAQSNKGCY